MEGRAATRKDLHYEGHSKLEWGESDTFLEPFCCVSTCRELRDYIELSDLSKAEICSIGVG